MLTVQPNRHNPSFQMKSLVILKPDVYARNLESVILSVLRDNNIIIEKAGYVDKLPLKFLKEHYAHHSDKPFFPKLLEYMQSGKAGMMVVEDKKALMPMRKIAFKIRDLFVPETEQTKNLIHASETAEDAAAEIARAENFNLIA